MCLSSEKGGECYWLPRISILLQRKKVCFGFDLSNNNDLSDSLQDGIQLDILLNAYANFPNKELFFNSFFKRLAGNELLQAQITQGFTDKQIKATWQKELKDFKQIRKKYLLYEDFE